MPLPVETIRLAKADIALMQTSGDGLPLVMLHGSGFAKEVFARQFDSPLGRRHRLIGIDLPGHGASSNAAEPSATYTLAGFAETVIEVLDRLRIERVAILGWSLGGHVAVELLARPGMVSGVMLVGAPPVGRGPLAMLRGFQTHRGTSLAGKPNFSKRDVERFVRLCIGEAAPEEFYAMVRRADGRVRTSILMSMLRGEGVDQKRVVERASVPVAIVNGEHEPVAKQAFLEGLDMPMLWRKRCYVMAGVGHAPFYQAAVAFNALLHGFLSDADAGAPAVEVATLRAG